jgi:predicted dehydrogenase
MPRIAILGLGSIGSRHANNCLELGYTDLIGMDPNPNIAETRFPVVNTMTAVQFFEPTHVLVCSPPQEHFHQAQSVMGVGRCHVFIEKPMTMTADEARRLCEYAEYRKETLAVGYMERAHPTVQAAKQYAATNHIEEAIIQCFWTRTSKSYHLSVEAESSHAIDTALYLNGPIEKVECVYRYGADRVEVWVQHRNGCATRVHMAQNLPPSRHITLSGKYVDEMFDRSYGEVPARWDYCYKAELVAFLNGEPLCTGRDGLAVMEVLEAMR